MSHERYRPAKRLSLLVSLPQNTGYEGGVGIDTLYIEILTQAFCDVDLHSLEPDDQEVFHHLRSAVGAVLLVFNPLSMKSLSDLLSGFGTPSDVLAALSPLHSLLLIPDDFEDPICTFHKSFPDFLTDPKRCKDKQFFVDPSIHHTELLLSCLNLMKRRLKRNICNLDDHAVLSKVKDLPAHQKSHIGGALEYACCFWTRHLVKTPSSGCDAEKVQKAINEFFTKYLLLWIEVLVVMGNLDVGVYAINDVRQWYISVSCEEFVFQTLYSQLI